MPLTEEQKALVADLEVTYNTVGWERLMQGWREEYTSLPETSFLNAKSMEDLNADRVRYRLLHELLSLPQDLEDAQGQAEESEEESHNPYE